MTISSGISLMDDIGKHALPGQGKRLRPLLFVLSARLCGYNGKDIYSISTLFEYVHCASLLHDDVIDNAGTRRNKPSARSLWGNSAAVLTGYYLSSKAMVIALSANNIDFLKMIVSTAGCMPEGQFPELIQTNGWDISKGQYMEIIIRHLLHIINVILPVILDSLNIRFIGVSNGLSIQIQYNLQGVCLFMFIKGLFPRGLCLLFH
jgi:octaprenyl-diphosphate synthase